MFSKLKLAALSLAFCASLAPASKADGFGISYSKSSNHGAFSVGYSSGPYGAPYWAPSYRVRRPYPRWVAGHYEIVRERVWVPGCVTKVWVEPAYEWRRDVCGRTYSSCVATGHYEMVKQPGHYESRDVKVWVPGGWRS
jgi:hypothetical protein